jgi:hypothetical protein
VGKHLIIGATALLALAGGGYAARTVQQQTVASNREAEAVAKVIDRLKDPESARIRNVRSSLHSLSSGERYVCGEVNAKNAHGGYVGFRNFVVTNDGDVFIENDKGIDVIIDFWCGKEKP